LNVSRYLPLSHVENTEQIRTQHNSEQLGITHKNSEQLRTHNNSEQTHKHQYDATWPSSLR